MMHILLRIFLVLAAIAAASDSSEYYADSSITASGPDTGLVSQSITSSVGSDVSSTATATAAITPEVSSTTPEASATTPETATATTATRGISSAPTPSGIILTSNASSFIYQAPAANSTGNSTSQLVYSFGLQGFPHFRVSYYRDGLGCNETTQDTFVHASFSWRAGLFRIVEYNDTINLTESTSVVSLVNKPNQWSPIQLTTTTVHSSNSSIPPTSVQEANTTFIEPGGFVMILTATLSTQTPLTFQGMTLRPDSLKYSLAFSGFPYKYENSSLAILKAEAAIAKFSALTINCKSDGGICIGGGRGVLYFTRNVFPSLSPIYLTTYSPITASVQLDNARQAPITLHPQTPPLTSLLSPQESTALNGTSETWSATVFTVPTNRSNLFFWDPEVSADTRLIDALDLNVTGVVGGAVNSVGAWFSSVFGGGGGGGAMGSATATGSDTATATGMMGGGMTMTGGMMTTTMGAAGGKQTTTGTAKAAASYAEAAKGGAWSGVLVAGVVTAFMVGNGKEYGKGAQERTSSRKCFQSMNPVISTLSHSLSPIIDVAIAQRNSWVENLNLRQLNTPIPTTPAPQQYVAPVQVQPVPVDIIPPSHVVEKTSNVEATDETSSTTVESTTSASTLPVPKPITPQPASTAANSSRSSTPVAKKSNPIKKASTLIPTNPPAEVNIEKLEMESLNPDAIASNNVLESEHTALLAQIAAHKKPVPEDLMDRKAGYELRMNLLVTLVSTGALTMNKYIENVKTNIGTTKKQALLLKQHGKVELARQAMARIKIMMEEVEEVEKAIAAGEL
ncbi:Coiled-coil and C2 domain-containing protein 1B [Rhizoclosmatium sp. JEL0117]|nr:Coiled-coil and C2 domain-containing protein 1B [Rhizoclosmatium sp. JEL0117]